MMIRIALICCFAALAYGKPADWNDIEKMFNNPSDPAPLTVQEYEHLMANLHHADKMINFKNDLKDKGIKKIVADLLESNLQFGLDMYDKILAIKKQFPDALQWINSYYLNKEEVKPIKGKIIEAMRKAAQKLSKTNSQ